LRHTLAPETACHATLPHVEERARARGDEFVRALILHLWKAGKALNDDAEVDAWVDERAESILNGKASVVAAGMRRAATRRGLSKKERKAIDACADYLLNHKAYPLTLSVATDTLHPEVPP